MRRTRTAIALSLAAALTLAACGGGGDAAPAAGGGAEETSAAGGDGGGEGVTIGIKFDQPGLGLQEGAEYTGFDVDVARYVADKLGYSEDQIEFVESISSQRETLL